MKKVIILFAIVSMPILSSSNPQCSNYDIICDADFCYWRLNNSRNFIRLDKSGRAITFWEARNHKIYRGNKLEQDHEVWSIRGDTLATDYFSGRIVYIRHNEIVLENVGKIFILFRIYNKWTIKQLNEARYRKRRRNFLKLQ